LVTWTILHPTDDVIDSAPRPGVGDGVDRSVAVQVAFEKAKA
jgi:hypothetical protein